MQDLWESFLDPLVGALRPSVVVEVGGDGSLTARLLEHESGAVSTVHRIDPDPADDTDDVGRRFGDRFVLHRALAEDALRELWPVDLALIDGDHNFYSVVRELSALSDRAAQADELPPVIALHDVDWPYGRRDVYADPDRIPAEARHPFARKGLRPDEPGLVDDGLNAHLCNALEEGGPDNGVRTAVEHFIAGSQVSWTFVDIPGLHGLGVLVATDLLAENGRVRDVFEEIQTFGWMNRRARQIEEARIWSEVRRVSLRRRLDAADSTPDDGPVPVEAGTMGRRSLQAALDESVRDVDRQALRAARAQIARLEKALREQTASADQATSSAVSDADVQLLQAELVQLRDELRDRNDQLSTLMAKRDAEDSEPAPPKSRVEAADGDQAGSSALASADHEDLANQLEHARALIAELEERLEHETASAAAAVSGRRRLEQDIADVRETLERELTEEQAAAQAARHRVEALEGELREAHGTLEDAGRTRERLQAGLADARAELEFAQAERDALHRELTRVTSDLEDARVETERATTDIERLSHALTVSEDERHRLRLDLERASGRLDTALSEARSAQQAAESATQRAELAEADLRTLREDRDLLAATVESLERRVSLAPSGGARPALTAPAANVVAKGGSHGLDPSSREYEPRVAFLEQYLATLGWTRRPLSGPDPMARPHADQHRSVFIDREQQGDGGPSIDIVVCVHNALEDVRLCLWSLAAKSDLPFRLILVNDGSDEETTAYLQSVAAGDPAISLIHNTEPPHGYTVAANLGLRAAEADYVVLLNSDTIVPYGWLQRIVDAGESDERIGILGPLSNAASHQSVPRLRDAGAWATNPLAPWLTPDGMALIVSHVSPARRPRLPFINGFCYVIKRAVIDAIGYFDEENFASGYSEENDYSYRAAQAGFELAVVDDGYVYHAKSKSFSPEGRNVHARRNYEIFLDKHGREIIQERVQELETNTALAPLRAAVEDASSSPVGTAAALREGIGPLTVVFVLPGLGDGGSGGSHSIYQEVRGLRQLGVDARIALAEHAFPRAQAAYEDAEDIFQTFRDGDDLAAKTEDADVISATHFKSVALVARVRETRDDFLPAYYIQDYEPFFAAADPTDVEEAIASYTAIEDVVLFAKTHWLCNVVGRIHGLHVAKVEPSIDEQLFVPPVRPPDDRGPVRVVGMIRPRTPRRQPFGTVAVLEALQERFGDAVEVVTFGCSDADIATTTNSPLIRARHLGLLTRHRVAGLLAGSDIFLDLSMYQAFGRTALEAMACGCTAVVPRLGGVWEFARDTENLLAVDTLDELAAFEALASLVEDRPRLREMQANARETASRYSILRAALSEYVVFAQEHAKRFGRNARRTRA